MKRKRSWIAVAAALLMLVFLALAVALQSAYLLYAASLMPVFIVPFLPDIRSNQWVKPGGKRGVDLYLLKPPGASRAEFLVLEFKPGTLQWSRHRLYFPVIEDKYPVFQELKESNSVSLSVLPFDLGTHRRKAGWYRIELHHLIGRASGFSFTHNEVGRLIIRLEDLRALAGDRAAAPPAASNKGLQA